MLNYLLESDHPEFNIQNPTLISESDAALAGAEKGEAEAEGDEGPDFGFGDVGAGSSFRNWEFYKYLLQSHQSFVDGTSLLCVFVAS